MAHGEICCCPKNLTVLIHLRTPASPQVAVSEELVWHVVDLLQRVLAHQALPGNGTAAAGGGSGAGPAGGAAVHDTAAADMPLRMGLLHVDNLQAELSFRGDPLSRPK